MRIVNARTAVAVGLLGALLAGAVAYGVGANQPAPARATTVAVVDLEKTFKQSKKYRDAETRLKRQIAEGQQRLNAIAREINEKNESLRELPASAPQRQTISDEVRRLAAEGQILEENLARKNNSELLAMFLEFHRDATAAIQVVAERDGFELVLLDDRGLRLPDGPSAAAADVAKMILQDKRVLFANERIDITDRVVNRMEVAAGAGG